MLLFVYYYVECHYAECHILLTIRLSVIMLNVVMLSVIMLSVVAPPGSGKTPRRIIYGRKKFNSSGPYTLPPPP